MAGGTGKGQLPRKRLATSEELGMVRLRKKEVDRRVDESALADSAPSSSVSASSPSLSGVAPFSGA